MSFNHVDLLSFFGWLLPACNCAVFLKTHALCIIPKHMPSVSSMSMHLLGESMHLLVELCFFFHDVFKFISVMVYSFMEDCTHEK